MTPLVPAHPTRAHGKIFREPNPGAFNILRLVLHADPARFGFHPAQIVSAHVSAFHE
jgi:hypothetical protein